MAIMKKKDDGKKPKASASKSTVKTPASKPKPLSNAGKYGLGAVARTVKGQGEMKQMLAPPKSGMPAKPKVKPNRDQRARAAGMVAAQRSRREGAKINAFDKFADSESQKFMNDVTEMPSYKGTKNPDNRYSGLSNNQIENLALKYSNYLKVLYLVNNKITNISRILNNKNLLFE